MADASMPFFQKHWHHCLVNVSRTGPLKVMIEVIILHPKQAKKIESNTCKKEGFEKNASL